MELEVEMPYIGKALSVNYYHLRFGSRVTTKIRPEVKLWMSMLTEKVKNFEHSGDVAVSVFGKFVDGRVPDLDNLGKVILDSIKVGINLDDRHIKYRTLGYDTGYAKPKLIITLSSTE
jgi:Holliday junction resolvase RusA-like endonuclease